MPGVRWRIGTVGMGEGQTKEWGNQEVEGEGGPDSTTENEQLPMAG